MGVFRYGAHAATLEQAPSGGAHSKMVPVELLEAFSQPAADGAYYLRRDRIKVRHHRKHPL